MKSHHVILFLLMATIGITAQAQMGRHSGKRIYDPTTEVTISGTVGRVVQQSGRRGWHGTHLVVKTENGVIEVHAGPSDYIASQQFSFAAGDVVEITGSKVKLQNRDVIIAREIKKDGKTLVLRDEQGVPKWSGGRRA